jgi:hypothetical protein
MSTKNDRFSCLDFKEKAQAEIYEQTKGMTRARLGRYFETRVESGPFAELWKRIPTRSARSKPSSPRRVS